MKTLGRFPGRSEMFGSFCPSLKGKHPGAHHPHFPKEDSPEVSACHKSNDLMAIALAKAHLSHIFQLFDLQVTVGLPWFRNRRLCQSLFYWNYRRFFFPFRSWPRMMGQWLIWRWAEVYSIPGVCSSYPQICLLIICIYKISRPRTIRNHRFIETAQAKPCHAEFAQLQKHLVGSQIAIDHASRMQVAPGNTPHWTTDNSHRGYPLQTWLENCLEMEVFVPGKLLKARPQTALLLGGANAF